MFKNALVSVSDKTGLIEFIRPLFDKGMRVVSTGGTAKHLKENGIEVVEIQEQTGFPEVMDGRVKTLHPNVHMCLLARENNSEDQKILESYDLKTFDLVVGNLYPFEQSLKQDLPFNQQIEFIDIGGPSFLRSASKNSGRIATVCDPDDYSWILEKGELTKDDKVYLASKVFSHTSSYDSLIAKYLRKDLSSDYKYKEYNFAATPVSSLRYGENPQQKALWLKKKGAQHGLHNAEVLQGKALSFNNILDLEASVATLRRFPNSKAVVSVKHNNPCGVALGADINESLKKSLAADPMSVFGGIVAIDGEVNQDMSEQLVALFLECVVAKSYSAQAMKVLSKKKNLRLLAWPELMATDNEQDIRSVSGGYLVQEKDPLLDGPGSWSFPHETPDAPTLADLNLAWRVCAQLKSNAISIVQGGQTLGLGMGQVNRVDAVKLAIERAKGFHSYRKNMVLASDAFFPFADSVEIAAQAGIKWIIQPGGSIKDKEVLKRAQELGVNIVLTGVRHFLH